MSEATANRVATAEQIDGIPLFLIPKTIAEQIRKKLKIRIPDHGYAELYAPVYRDC